MRTAGEKGEAILINELKYSRDFTVRVASASVFFYRLCESPEFLEMKLNDNDYISNSKYLPGYFCQYNGKISPLVFEEEFSHDYLEINSRDFLAALQRMLMLDYNHQSPQLIHIGKPLILDNIVINITKSSALGKRLEFFSLEPSLFIGTQASKDKINEFGVY